MQPSVSIRSTLQPATLRTHHIILSPIPINPFHPITQAHNHIHTHRQKRSTSRSLAALHLRPLTQLSHSPAKKPAKVSHPKTAQADRHSYTHSPVPRTCACIYVYITLCVSSARTPESNCRCRRRSARFLTESEKETGGTHMRLSRIYTRAGWPAGKLLAVV